MYSLSSPFSGSCPYQVSLHLHLHAPLFCVRTVPKALAHHYSILLRTKLTTAIQLAFIDCSLWQALSHLFQVLVNPHNSLIKQMQVSVPFRGGDTGLDQLSSLSQVLDIMNFGSFWPHLRGLIQDALLPAAMPILWVWQNSSHPACQCSALGSYPMPCSPVTGQCECLPGITGQRCDRCLSGAYDFPQCQGRKTSRMLEDWFLSWVNTASLPENPANPLQSHPGHPFMFDPICLSLSLLKAHISHMHPRESRNYLFLAKKI
jgi:hypothetical protein